MHRICVGTIDCTYKNGSLVYKLYDTKDRTRIMSDNNELFADMLAEFVCLQVKKVRIEGEVKLVSDTCIVFSSDELDITPIMKGE